MAVNKSSVKKQITTVLASLALIAALSSCGVSTDTGTPTDTPSLVNQFSITAYGNTGAFVPIDFGASNSVLFDMSWNVTSSDPYSVTAHLSSDANVSIDDQLFLETTCGSSIDYICTSLGEQECGISYEPDAMGDHYILRCPHGPATIDTAEITLRLQAAGFPAASLINYIIFTACNGSLDSCSTASVQIQLFDSVP